jgi:hypothetical protein
MGIFLRRAAFDEIASEDNGIGRRIEPVEGSYRPFESGCGVDDPHQERPRRGDVGIGDVGDQHRDLGLRTDAPAKDEDALLGEQIGQAAPGIERIGLPVAVQRDAAVDPDADLVA